MEEKHGKFPANARVDVDYSKGKPKIKFSYPNNGQSPDKQSLSQNSVGVHTLIIFSLILILPLYTTSLWADYEVDYPERCNATFQEGFANISINVIGFEDGEWNNASTNRYREFTKGVNITCGDKIYELEFSKEGSYYDNIKPGFKKKYHAKESYIWLRNFFGVLFILLSLAYFINRIVTKILIKTEWYQKKNPVFQARGKKKYIKFEPKDVENNMVEIPYFGNVVLDYKTTGDFNKYLERIKIREHQYNEYKKGKVGKKKVEIYKWYARFFFKEKPKTGTMEVIYR